LAALGLRSYVAGDILYADVSGNLARLPIGSNGQIIKISGGLPSWGADIASGGSGGATAWATTTDSLAVYPSDTTDVVIIGNSATTTLTSIFEVIGKSYFSDKVGIGTTSAAALFSLQGNALFSGNLSVANIIATGTVSVGSLSVGSLSGLLYGTNGSVGTIATNTLGLLASSSISATGPLSYNVATGVFSISQSGTATDGYLSSTDFNTFNNKVSSSSLLSTLASAYPFQLTGNATSTLTQFNGGLTAYASSTIGNGSQASGLTISGGATTTGNSRFEGSLSLGTTGSISGSGANLSIITGSGSGGILTLQGNSLVINSNNSNGVNFQNGGTNRFSLNGSNNFVSTASGGGAFLTAASSATSPAFAPKNTDLTTGLGSAVVGQLSLITGGLEAIRINASQNVAIGTTSASSSRLTIAATSSASNLPLFDIQSPTTKGVATTSIFSVNAVGSTTLFQIPSSLLKTDSNGTIIAAVAGIDYITSSQVGAAIPIHPNKLRQLNLHNDRLYKCGPPLKRVNYDQWQCHDYGHTKCGFTLYKQRTLQ
jgi:hypothetical protein